MEDWEAITGIPETVVPIAVVDSSSMLDEVREEVAMEDADASTSGKVRKPLHEQISGTDGNVFEPFDGIGTSASSSPIGATPSVPDPRDPAWLSNQKNCTRAIKGEGKECWVDGRWVHVRTGEAREGMTPTVAGTAAAANSASAIEVDASGVVMLTDDAEGLVDVHGPDMWV
jgi:hypothetical protein|eukprot:evm.model.NODE_165_length_4495_cov_85.018021.4